nr:MAG TPA: hypothetical protein [Caudoviricetes sp.]
MSGGDSGLAGAAVFMGVRVRWFLTGKRGALFIFGGSLWDNLV